jgi:hypothetical protein
VSVVGLGGEAGAEIGDGGASDFQEEIAVNARGERGQTWLAQEFVDRRDLAEQVGFGGAGHGDISAQNDRKWGNTRVWTGLWYRCRAAEVRCCDGSAALWVPLTLTEAISTMNREEQVQIYAPDD